MSELRYHPFLGTWVITATHRQDRTFLPPADFCPLCPTERGGFPTEIPMPDYDLVVFENKFPSLRPDPAPPEVEGTELMPVLPSHGVCEVVCYSSRHDASLASLPQSQVRKLTRVWKDRYIALGARPEVEYVFIFENKGKEIGVTLSHPHGQIYAYPYIPPVLATELGNERTHFQRTGRSLWQDWLDAETRDGRRIVWQNEEFIVAIPFFARYPYEVYVVPKRGLRSLEDFGPRELDSLAETLSGLTKALDSLFGFSLPYIMVIHQKPTIEGYDFTRFHVEFYPPYRTATKLKYLAGSEAGAGAFINDTLPEQKAAELRALMSAIE